MLSCTKHGWLNFCVILYQTSIMKLLCHPVSNMGISILVSIIYLNKISKRIHYCLEKVQQKPVQWIWHSWVMQILIFQGKEMMASTLENLLWKERDLWWALASTLSTEKALVVDLPAEASPRTDDTLLTPVTEASPCPPVAASAYTISLGCEHLPSSRRSLPVDSVLCVAHRNEPWFFHGQVPLFPEPRK